MGLYPVKIHFKEEIPSFLLIRQQYKQQTGLSIELMATIHLATDNWGELLNDSSKLLPMLQADSDTLASNKARYEAEKSLLVSTDQYEKLALLRDQTQKEKELLNHIKATEIMVGYGNFYLIEMYLEGKTVTVHKYANQHYAVVSLIKVLVDLGGQCRWNGKNHLPKSWQKLKRWEDYRWYNRPRK